MQPPLKSFSMEQVPPPPTIDAPPVLPPAPEKRSNRRWLAQLLSFCLLLFLVDGAVSFADDALILLVGVHGLSLIRGLISFATLVMAGGVYLLIGITPAVPKRIFLPIPLFFLASMLAMFTLAIFWYHRIEEIAFAVSTCELVLGVLLVSLSRRENSPKDSRIDRLNQGTGGNSLDVQCSRVDGGGRKAVPREPRPATEVQRRLVTEEQLGARGFSWANLLGFAALNIFVLLPLVAIYLFGCGARAVNHFSEGFMALHPGGFTVQVRKYVRADGKVIELFPMAHVAAPSFYSQVSRSFPTNAVILMEGVSDSENLLTNKISYKRMAKTLGLAEQHETFAPNPQEVVRADVDVNVFSRQTIDFLNLIMLFHSKGMTPENLSKFLQYTPPPGFEKQLFDDLLVKRNDHLLGEIRTNLQTSDNIMVPWGVAHMPGLAREIQKDGFHLSETRNIVVIPFGPRGRPPVK
jgi:hypothetical protein